MRPDGFIAPDAPRAEIDAITVHFYTLVTTFISFLDIPDLQFTTLVLVAVCCFYLLNPIRR
jgi:hypothetical protein